MAQTKTITGVVVDATGEPVIGASVLEVGTTNGTITDVDGNFTIQVPVGAKLDVSYIGYKTQQIVVGVPNTYKVILKEDAEMLSSPMYGATVMASTSRCSKKLRAYMAEVLPMSPRFASAMMNWSG